MSTNRTWIGEKAGKCPQLVFTSLYHHITDVDNLRACHEAMDGRKAVGIDGVTKEMYGENLEEKLQDLSARLGRMGYRPQAKRRTYVPKPGSSKGRPLGISCYEDKLVELAVKQVLEPIYETMFEPCSYGYRPGQDPHRCLDALGKTVQQRPIRYVVEADIRGFFDNVNHEWMITFLKHRIGDPRVLRLIQRMLKGGIMEDGLTRVSEAGTPQGSILSPLLSNIYLHYVLDIWFRAAVVPNCRGEAHLFRYADDFVACFERQAEAERFLRALRARMEKFHLQLADEKTRCIEFGRYARKDACRRGKKPAEFTFLGFTHYCGKTRNGYFKVKRRTSRTKLHHGLQELGEWLRKRRSQYRTGALLRMACSKVRGHLQYYAITDNATRLSTFLYHATRLVFKWVNRRSQRRSYNWPAFRTVLRHVGWPAVKIRHRLCPFRALSL